MREAPPRITSLDSLRGIAALLVVLHHLWLLGAWEPTTPWQWRLLRYTPFNIVVEGRQPVILFFVLSGFVLAQTLIAAPTPYVVFIVRRFVRIYFPFAAAIVLSGVCYALLDPAQPRPFSAWFGGLWRGGHDAAAVVGHLLMRGTGRDDFDPVVWSLVHELRISAALPALLWLCRRRPVMLLACGVAAQWLVLPFCIDPITSQPCRAWSQCRPFWGADATGSLLVSAYFVCFFVFGIALALRRDALRRLFRTRSRKALGALAALGLLCGFPAVGDLGFGIGAALLIALGLEWRGLQAALCRTPLLWLGRVSYSLYLVHVPVFLALIHALGPRPALVPCLLPCALIAAWLFHKAVEHPAQRLGRIMTLYGFGASAPSASARA